ncbi:TetR/AcrR family transcriptional regulator [Fodinicola acaciae]|uniref:TetR/AcrR family transcriptional regulator n=1 Tax=Fodinicola acaciae TaxID=2681555 RepID=UPI0013D81252|nr:TetR family transcriptional regulator [Fodinicola acaciae]
MSVAGRTPRAERAQGTRELILVAAERLFAEHGVFVVSNRQVSEAAGQGNNAAVGYHFGTKTDLIRAIIRKHNEEVGRLRAQQVATLSDPAGLRDWVGCLVRPMTEHLAALGNPTWYARFSAQVMTDPVMRRVVIEESRSSPSLQQVVDGLRPHLPDLPPDVRAERNDMARQLIVHICAERERALAEGTPTPRASWHDAATGLVDGIVGLWEAPVSR